VTHIEKRAESFLNGQPFEHHGRFVSFAGGLSPTVLVKAFDESGLSSTFAIFFQATERWVKNTLA
jgi:hypothetical protein